MIQAYHMVALNIVLTSALCVGLFFYRYIYPKRKINLFYLLLLVSFLPLVSVLRQGTYESGDLTLHATRAISFYNALVFDHVLPRWAAEINLGYGDTYFEFIYLLPYLIISFFHLIGFSFLASVKLLLAFSYILSGAFMYLWVKKEFGEKAGFVAAVFYLFTPYHLVDMHFRVTIAETLSFTFIPLLFISIRNLIQKGQIKWIILTSFTVCLFMLTHQVIFVLSSPLFLTYGLIVWYYKKDRAVKDLRWYFLSFLTGALLATFYWLPILVESKYIYQIFYNKTIDFPLFWMLFFSPWRFGLLFQGHHGELSFALGYTQWLVFIVGVFLYFKHRFIGNQKVLIQFSLIAFLGYFLMMNSFTKFIWDVVPLINNVQFTYRLLVMCTFCISLIAGILTTQIKSDKFMSLLCIITIVYTILNWGNRGTLPYVTDEYLKNDLLHGKTLTGYPEPTAPKWVDPAKISFVKRPTKRIEVVEGDATIGEGFRNSVRHDYKIEVHSLVLIKENTFYFPGWKIIANGKDINIDYENKNFPGVISFKLYPGTYNVEVLFVDTFVRSISKKISLITLFLVLLVLVLKVCLRFKKSN